MKPFTNKKLSRLIYLSLFGVVSFGQVQAIDFGTSLLYQFERSDNIDRVTDAETRANPDARQDGSRQSLIGDLSGSSRSKFLDMDFDLELGVTKGDGDEDQQVTTARGNLYSLFNLRPGQVSWLLADYVVQQGEDLVALSDENESTRANFFITGPSTHWRITPVDTINLDLFYLLGDQQGDPEQTQQLIFQSDWSHRFSLQNAMSLHYDTSEIGYKVSDDEFSITNIYARYSYTKGDTNLNLDAGTSRSVNNSIVAGSTTRADTTTDETLLRLGFDRQLSRETSFSFNASQIYTDETMGTIRDLQESISGGIDLGAGPFYEKRVATTLSRRDSIWNGSFTLSHSDIAFVEETNDSDRDGDRTTKLASLTVGYTINPIWELHASASLADIEYANSGNSEERLDYGVGVSYQITPTLGAALDATFDSIDSREIEQGLIEENSLLFSLFWRPQSKLWQLRETYETQQLENVLQ